MNYLGLLVIVFILGILRIMGLLIKTRNKNIFLNKYISKLIDLKIKFPNFDSGDYTWLVMNSDRAQKEISNYVFINTKYGTQSNIIKDTLNQALLETTTHRRDFINLYKGASLTLEFCGIAYNSILSKIGTNSEVIKELFWSFFNPLKWLYYGIELILVSILLPLSAFKILTPHQIENITQHWMFRLAALLFTITFTVQSILSNTVTIVTGWEAFMNIIIDTFHLNIF